MNTAAPFLDLLEHVVDNRGKTCPTATSGTPLIATNCVKESTLFPVFEKVRYVDEATMSNWFRGHPQPGDILFVCKGTPGQTCLVPDPFNFCIAQDMVAVRADKDKVYPAYLFAALRSSVVQRQIANMHVGTMIPHFKKGDFDKLLIPLPDEDTQIAIGDLYLCLSEKIDVNRRMNETLEAQARALFRDWFVDFGPVKANMAGDTPYLAPDLWSLFPNCLDDDGVPEGWAYSTIGTEVDAVGGSTPSTKDAAYWDGDIAWTTPKDLSGLNSPILLETSRSITPVGLAKISSGLLPEGTVLLSSRAPVGYLAITQIPLAVNQGYIAMRCEGRISNYFAYLWAKENMDLILQNANGSTFQEISKKNFRPLPVIVAEKPIHRQFDNMVEPFFEKIVANELENRTLANTRDLLLPKLMSGEIRVGEAEREIERA
ncbi:restriction endonuclease subunit S [Erythrobacter sp. MTPC3]|uniref:restriction endonuclease subunit S n=1 Tax=Erythrobacter sp. MTPC3 TaxID=3056564 RepID=UPI0036F4485B